MDYSPPPAIHQPYVAPSYTVQVVEQDTKGPEKLDLIKERVNPALAITAFEKIGVLLDEEELLDLGPDASQGYHYIDGATRYMFQAKGQFASTHMHSKEELSFVAFGGMHTWIFIGDNVFYAFYKKGDTMIVPPYIPHAVVAASFEDEEGVVTIRSSDSNPQILGDFPLPLPLQD